MEDMKKRRKDLAEKLEQLRKKLEQEPGVEAIEREISKYKEEETELKNRLGCLSAKGAVGYPFASFMVALLSASYNIYTSIVDLRILLLAIGAMSFGIYRLGKTLVAIERAALRPEEKFLPAFRVAFESGATIEKFKPSEEKAVPLLVYNYGKDAAENVEIMFFFPPQFGVLPQPSYSLVKQPSFTTYPEYNATVFRVEVFHVDIFMLFSVSAKMPDAVGRYEIPAIIRARRIGKSEHKLSIEIAS